MLRSGTRRGGYKLLQESLSRVSSRSGALASTVCLDGVIRPVNLSAVQTRSPSNLFLPPILAYRTGANVEEL